MMRALAVTTFLIVTAWGGALRPAPNGSVYQIVFAGDSLTYSSPFGASSPSSYPYVFCHSKTTCSYVNTGASGSTSSNVVSRYASDVTANNPRYLIIMMGTNDAAYGTGQAAVNLLVANYTTVLNNCASAGIIPVVILIPPNTYASTERSTFYDNANAAIVTLLGSYPDYVLVDPRPSMGQFRPGGAANNLWDIKPAYDGDGTHFTAAGYSALATVVWETLNASRYVTGGISMGGAVHFSGAGIIK